VLCAIFVPSGSCEGSRALSFCHERMSRPSRHSSGVLPSLRATAASVVPCQISSRSMPWSLGVVVVTCSSVCSRPSLGGMPKRCVVPVMPTASHQRWISPRPTRSTTVPVHVLSLTMIIITSASRKVIQKPGVRCWNVPESLSWYFLSIVTFWSSDSLPACTAASAAIMIEILRVLAEGTGTPPKRSARWPVVMSLTYQLDWKGSASHISLRRTTRSRMALSRSLFLVQPDVPEVHEGSRLVALDLLAARVEAEVVADLDAGGVGVEDGLQLLDDGLALLHVA